jgi:GT2 family glycosyltransferase
MQEKTNMIAAPCQILLIDLLNLPKDLNIGRGYRSALVIFWWRGRPLGRALLVAGEFPLSRASIGSLAAQSIAPALGTLIAPHSFPALLPDCDNDTANLKVVDPSLLDRALDRVAPPSDDAASICAQTSVIVCTRERPELLEECLVALVKLAPSPLEIIVVDNAPPGGISSLGVVENFKGVSYLRHSSAGLSSARNAGLALARGDYVAFTDDDSVVHPRWLVSLLTGFAADTVGCVTGLVLPRELETEAQMAFEFVLGGFSPGLVPLIFGRDFFASTRPFGVPVWRIGAGASMAFRRAVFAAIGTFDERLGAGASGCSEDSELWYRLLGAGWECRYEPSAVVFHRHRLSWDALESQIVAYMRGHVAALLVQFVRTRDLGNLRRIFLTLPYVYTAGVMRAVLHRNWRHFRMDLCAIRGCLGGLRLRYLLRNRPCTPRQTAPV